MEMAGRVKEAKVEVGVGVHPSHSFLVGFHLYSIKHSCSELGLNFTGACSYVLSAPSSTETALNLFAGLVFKSHFLLQKLFD